jgi:hypothetical protein
LALAGFWLTLAACSHVAGRGSAVPAGDNARAQLSIGYSTLYAEADGIPKLRWLLMFKDKSEEMAKLTHDLVGYYEQLADRLRDLSKRFPAVRIDVPPMSKIEGEERKAIGEDIAKDLAPVIGKSGIDFEREALLTFYEALNEERHLVGVMLPLETVPALRDFLATTKSQLDERYARVGALLNRRYFTH